MPSDSKKKEMQRKKDARTKKVNGGKSNEEKKVDNGAVEMTEEEILCSKLEEEARINKEARSCTGTLAVHPRSRDIKIENFSITFFGAELLQDTMLELNCGRRYGLLGLNGSGKSSLLALLGMNIKKFVCPSKITPFYRKSRGSSSGSHRHFLLISRDSS